MYFIIQLLKNTVLKKRINKKDGHSEHTKGSGCVEQNNKSKATSGGIVLGNRNVLVNKTDKDPALTELPFLWGPTSSLICLTKSVSMGPWA